MSEPLNGGVLCDEKYRLVADGLLVSAIAYSCFKNDPAKLQSILSFLSNFFYTSSNMFITLWSYACASVGGSAAFLGLGVVAPFYAWNSLGGYELYRAYYATKSAYKYLLQFPMCTLLTQAAYGLSFVRATFFKTASAWSASQSQPQIESKDLIPLRDVVAPVAVEEAVEVLRDTMEMGAHSPAVSSPQRKSRRKKPTRRSPSTIRSAKRAPRQRKRKAKEAPL